MTTLLLREKDIPELTLFSGNIDSDKLKPFVSVAQKTKIKRILGTELYNKILTDFEAETLIDEYLTIYNDYIVYMLVYFSCANYIAFGSYKITNSGAHKQVSDNSENIDYKEVSGLVKRYEALAVSVETDFYSHMKTINIPEYSRNENKVKTSIIHLY